MLGALQRGRPWGRHLEMDAEKTRGGKGSEPFPWNDVILLSPAPRAHSNLVTIPSTLKPQAHLTATLTRPR